MSLKRFKIEGMHCKSCKMLIEDVMEDLGIEIKSFKVDEDKQVGKLEVETDKDDKEIIDAIQEEGDYKVSKG